ncbi:MAG TPA: MFS transporter, partial [Longimicrobiales bacterium]|nr:MFS transporter [Longimicrobiales bacterium]
ALPCVLYSMDLTVLHLAVPQLSAHLQPTSTQLLWIIDIYGFLVAGSLITMGTLGDRIGRRRLLLIGAGAFGLASVLAAFSRSAEMLIATRALLGIAGATVAPSTLSLIRNMFVDPKERTVAVSVWITSYSVGGAIGPLIGGLLLEFFWWGSVFLISVPVMVLLLAVGPFLLPEYRDPNAGRPDLISAALSLVAVLSIIFGLKQIAQDGIGWLPVASILVGLTVGIAFTRRQLQLTDPFIDLRLFGLPSFSASLATYGLGILVLFGGFLFLPQYLQLVLGLSPLQSGVWTLPWALAFIVGSTVTPIIVRKVRPVDLMVGGMMVAALGFAVFTQIDERTSFVTFAIGSFLFSLGFAPVFILTTDLIIGSAPPERAGAASAISETSAEFGGALGIALFGSIGVAIYRSALAGFIPESVSPELAEAARATLGGALTVAERLPADLAADLTDTARTAFIRGLRICATISAVGALVLASFVAFTLRSRARPAPASTVESALTM